MLKYTIKENESITNFLVSELTKKDYLVKKEIMTYDSYDKQCGFTERTYPCRKHFINNLKNHQFPENYENIKFAEYYFPFGNDIVEFNDFLETPTYLSRFAKTNIFVEKNKNIKFTFKTNGGGRLYFKKQKIDFINYTRNTPKQFEFDLNLKKGNNEIIIFFDDLAERDTIYFFQLIPHEKLEIHIPTKGKKQLIETIENAYFEQRTYQEKDIILNFPKNITLDGKCYINIKTDSIDVYEKIIILDIKKNTKKLKISNTEDLGFGYLSIKCYFDFQEINMTKKYAVENYPKKLVNQKNYNTIQERKKEHLQLCLKHGDDNSFKLFSYLELDPKNKKIQEIIDYEINRITLRKDCSDFYLVPLVMIYKKYENLEIIQKNKEKLKNLFLEFRYWYDEPGNDVMWFFSENHALLFHVLQYITGRYFPNETFKNSNKKGYENEQIAKPKINTWLDDFIKGGLTEWNSTSYIPIDLIGFFALLDTEVSEFKEKAKIALDLIFETIDIFSFNGNNTGSTQGRAYEKSLRGPYNDSVTCLNYIATNKGVLNPQVKGNILFSISNYKPKNKNLINIEKTIKQGLHQEVYTKIIKNEDFCISYVEDYFPYQRGYQEHIFSIMFSDFTNFWINHPGEYNKLGTARPSYWGGNGNNPKITKIEDFYLLDFKLEKEFPNFTHAYFDINEFDYYSFIDNVIVGIKNNIRLTISANKKLIFENQGFYKNKEIICYGQEMTWIIHISNTNTEVSNTCKKMLIPSMK